MKPDPRWFQIFSLTLLLAYGVTVLHFDVTVASVSVVLGLAMFFQWLFSKIYSLPRTEYKSALISGLSLCLLMRADSPVWFVLGALLTIGSKFVIRARGKHLFNPTNFGIAVLLLASDRVWVSPGQWGSATVFAFFISCLGGMVVFRALRSDTAIAFLLCYPGLLLLRAFRLGDPFVIPLHQLENGALLLFAFFMISDPRTTPNTRIGRFTFCLLVSLIAYHLRFTHFTPNALLYSLLFCTPVVPLLDLLFGGSAYEWEKARLPAHIPTLTKETI